MTQENTAPPPHAHQIGLYTMMIPMAAMPSIDAALSFAGIALKWVLDSEERFQQFTHEITQHNIEVHGADTASLVGYTVEDVEYLLHIVGNFVNSFPIMDDNGIPEDMPTFVIHREDVTAEGQTPDWPDVPEH